MIDVIQQEILIYNQPDCILPKSFFEGRFIPDAHPDSLDWEQWWDEQIRRCKEGWSDGGHSITGPYYYHLNHKKINMLDEADRTVIDHPYYSFEDQELFNNFHTARSQGKGIILLTGRGFGKSGHPDTPCIMYDGRIKKMKDIHINDLLMGDDSTHRRVINVSGGRYNMYKIIPKKGESHIVNGRHILALYYNHQHNSIKYGWRAKSYVTMSVEDYIASSNNIKNHLTLYRRGWGDNFPVFENPEIPSYMLGLYLGDGTRLNGDITNPDYEIRDYVHSYATSIGYKVTYNRLRMKITKGLGSTKNIYTQKLIDLNILNNKHIPNSYLYSDKQTRLELLAGLLDTDGYLEPVCRNSFEIIQKDIILADQIIYLARSLGFYVHATIKTATLKREGFPVYKCPVKRIIINGNTEIIPTKVVRKQAVPRKQIKNHQHTEFTVESLGSGEYVSIETDGNHLFLLEDGTVTHNSFDVASIAEWEFIFVPASEVIVSASSDFFAKELWFKINLGLNSVDDEIRPNLLSGTKDYMESGMKWTDPETGKQKTIGYRSKMHRVVYDNEPGKTRGTRPNIHIFEEMGSWSGAAKLIDCYNMTEASWWRGSKFTCFPVLIGTGGQMKQGGSEDAKIMFYDPDAFNLIAFEWDNQKIGKFFPAYQKFGGYYESTGTSDVSGAKGFLDKRRERKRKNLKSFQQEIQEFPFNPEEAFKISGTNIFNHDKLYTRYAEIKKSKELSAVVQKGDLNFIRAGSKLIGVEWVANEKGIFEIAEHPHIDPVTHKPQRHLYISGCDSFDAVAEEDATNEDKSKGSIFVFKRYWKATETGKLFVAKITQRTNDASIFYWNTVKLNMYYGCQMLYEHTKVGIAQHYIINKLHHMLYLRPKLDTVGVIKKQYSTNTYGITMPIQIKQHAITRYSQYIEEYCDQMYFPSQILDAMEFRWGSSKHDETMAAAIAVLGDDDMHRVEIKENREMSMNFPKFVRDRNGKLRFM